MKWFNKIYVVYVSNAYGSNLCVSNALVSRCCRLLKVDEDTFVDSLVSRTIDVEGSKLTVPLTVDQVVLCDFQKLIGI